MSETIKNKLFYFGWIGMMILILVGIAYLSFLRSIDVDVMKDAEYVYTGENGNASLEVYNDSNDINQRTAEFLETVTYEVTPDSNLSNGDTVTIVANYDEALADEYNFNPVNIETEITVEGLVEKYEKASQIDEDYLALIQNEINLYIRENEDEIYELETDTHVNNIDVETTTLYTAFVKSNTSSNSDRIIQLVQLDYTQDDTTTTVYYFVCVPGINQSNEIDPQDIYSLKAYMSEEEIEAQDYASFFERIYGQQNEITGI